MEVVEARPAYEARAVQAAAYSTVLHGVMEAVEAGAGDAEAWTAAVSIVPVALWRIRLIVSRGSPRHWTCPTSPASVPGMGDRSSRLELHAAQD